ncbi:hypothetical protein AKJ52_00320 [candidate division MSBL1 archaeon SCGC-AAA382C18]|uniref:Butyrate kinase n=1 Tax=candidate division MSBL1 archaeon SCGC-AAA382C18 TaxID=1698281 RepID=A0A133VLT5_9EURY|nr:hypothetical protein AKJ52_00320 [candidate division MSBL1 archaeon SCGC-AAA382C18]
MVRALGIDPGTKSFDVCGLEDGEIIFEKVLDSSELAKNPELLIKAVEEAKPLDLIAGPSGYGVEVTYLSDLYLESLEDWYLTYILLLTKEDLNSALERDDPGIKVYSAMTQTALEMKRRDWPVCYIPGVINLPTVPERRKINNLDMGTVDKMCCGLLGIHDQARRRDIPYEETSFVLVEMGHGYNSILKVEDGKIVDGLGGTTNGIGFLTGGKMDLELVQLVGEWEKSDVFTGGAASIAKKKSPRAMIENRNEEEKCKIAWNAMLEGVERGVASMFTSGSDPKEILISGRLTRIDEVRKELGRRLESFAPIQKLGWLEGVDRVKEAAQGYAMAAEGLMGGEFSKLIDCARIEDAKGTALDYLYHPKGKSIKEKLENTVSFRP